MFRGWTREDTRDHAGLVAIVEEHEIVSEAGGRFADVVWGRQWEEEDEGDPVYLGYRLDRLVHFRGL